ncbi:MAG: hypothetical protein GY782_11390, partial [Gammaproteobacteria bacterium]|nr:hypothetical protein [Gammaproteobacteria bacterium]
NMKSYGTTWALLHKIREALRQRDENYKLSNIIELDGGTFGKKQNGNQAEVLVAIESKDWIDKQGRPKSKAGFAKILVAGQPTLESQAFLDTAMDSDSTIHTDARPSFTNLDTVKADHRVLSGNKEILDDWLP